MGQAVGKCAPNAQIRLSACPEEDPTVKTWAQLILEGDATAALQCLEGQSGRL